MVVAGDLTYAEQFIEVIRPQARVVVTDIDGTLTSSEYAALTDVAGLPPAEAHPGAADMLWAFAIRGYKVFYLTARPEWMTPLTREWLPLRGFPPGVLHTTLSKIGAVGSSATDAKTKELAWLHATTTIVPSYAFGNKTSDVAAYGGAGIEPTGCYYYELDGDAKGGTIHADYTALVAVAEQAPLACF
jgi:phosphatidate phosphatase PAH1